MAKRPPSQNGSRPAPRSRRSPTYAGNERLPRELFADEEVSKDHERRKHAPLRAEEQRERVELASLSKLNSEGESAVAIGSDSAALVVEGGKHKGEEVAFDQSGATLGRSSKCTLTLRMGAGVSRQHAKIVFVSSAGGFTIEDLGSRNGTNVNGKTIEGATFLRDRDLIEISAERIRFIGPSPREDDVNDTDAMPPPGFSLAESAPHSQMADVTAPSMAPAEVLRAAQALPPPPVEDRPPPAPRAPVETPLPPPLSPPPSPPLAAPRAPPPVPADQPPPPVYEPSSVAEPSAPAPTAPLPEQHFPEPLPPEPSGLPPALPHANSLDAFDDVSPPKKGGGSSVLLFALGIFLGVLMIGAAFGIDAFVLDGMVAKAVLDAIGMGGGDDGPEKPLIPQGPAVDVASRGGGEVKSIRVVAGDKVKVADVLGTIARGGPEDPAKHQKLLAEKTRLTRLTKSKRKKTRRIAKAKLAKIVAAIAASEKGPVKIYNIRSDADGVVKDIVMKVGDKLKAGDVVIRIVKPGAAAGGAKADDSDKAKEPAAAKEPASESAKGRSPASESARGRSPASVDAAEKT